MRREEENIQTNDLEDTIHPSHTNHHRTKLLDRISSIPQLRVRVRVHQTVREIIGLSVAVILGFNIGDGNLRDRLQGGQTFLRAVLCVSFDRI